MKPTIALTDKGCLLISGELSFATVTKLRQQGRQFILQTPDRHSRESGNPVLIFDLQSAFAKDSSGLALLTSWLRFAHKRQKKIYFINLPSQLIAMAKLSGVDNLLPIK